MKYIIITGPCLDFKEMGGNFGYCFKPKLGILALVSSENCMVTKDFVQLGGEGMGVVKKSKST